MESFEQSTSSYRGKPVTEVLTEANRVLNFECMHAINNLPDSMHAINNLSDMSGRTGDGYDSLWSKCREWQSESTGLLSATMGRVLWSMNSWRSITSSPLASTSHMRASMIGLHE